MGERPNSTIPPDLRHNRTGIAPGNSQKARFSSAEPAAGQFVITRGGTVGCKAIPQAYAGSMFMPIKYDFNVGRRFRHFGTALAHMITADNGPGRPWRNKQLGRVVHGHFL
jgi:hypothetical protein